MDIYGRIWEIFFCKAGIAVFAGKAADTSIRLLPCPSATIQRQITSISLKYINPCNIVQHTIVPYYMGCCNIRAVIHLKQHFFLVIGSCCRKYFFAVRVAKNAHTVPVLSRVAVWIAMALLFIQFCYEH